MTAHAVTVHTYPGPWTGDTYYRAYCACGWKSGGYQAELLAAQSGDRHGQYATTAAAS